MWRVCVPLAYTKDYKLLPVMREQVPTSGKKRVDIEPTIR